MEMKCPINSDQAAASMNGSSRPVNGTSAATTGPNQEPDFSEFEWMAEQDMDDFDRKVEDEFWEEHFIEHCFEEMWMEEAAREREDLVYFNIPESQPPQPLYARGGQNSPIAYLQGLMNGLSVDETNRMNNQVTSSMSLPPATSKLNPDAAVFVPRGAVTVQKQTQNVDR